MPDPVFAMAMTAAALAAAGGWLVVCGLLPRQIRLSDALGVLADGTEPDTAEQGPVVVTDPPPAWNSRAPGRLPTPRGDARLDAGTFDRRLLRQQAVLALGGLVLPLVLAASTLVGSLGAIPVGVGLICGVGWFCPLALRNQQQQTNADAEARTRCSTWWCSGASRHVGHPGDGGRSTFLDAVFVPPGFGAGTAEQRPP